MTTSTFASLRSKVSAPYRAFMSHDVSAFNDSIDRIGISTWKGEGVPGGTEQAAPTTAEALDYTGTTGPYSIRHPASDGLLGLTHSSAATTALTAPNAPSSLLIDRLSHQGGLVANVTTSQTTNLPTTALTRYTDGVGVWIGVNCYADMGATDSIISITYTNQAGTAGRVATMAADNRPRAGQMFGAILEGADTGARSVQSVQLSASTGAGTFGITLFKPLAMVPGAFNADLSTIMGWNVNILSEAHLELLHFNSVLMATTSNISVLGFTEL